MNKLLFSFFISALLAGVSAFGQLEPEPLGLGLEPLLDPGQSAVQSLEALERSLKLKEEELAEKMQELAAATEDSLRDELRNQVRDLRAEVEDKRRQFDGFAADVDLSVFMPHEAKKFDWQEQVGKLLEPIMAELENATKESRVIGQLRANIEEIRKRRDLAQEAVDNLNTLLKQEVSPELKARLESRLKIWKQTLDQANSEFTALDLQLQSRLAARESVLDQSTKYARHFFRTRGLNLLLGVVAFLVVFFGFRLTERIVHRSRAAKGEPSFSTRLTTLLFHIFSVLGGLIAMMIVFNVAGDWFLLGIVIIFLIGVGWAGIKTLPTQVETIKLMLNIGAVREGQALIFDNCVYRVDSLGFSAKISNPRLEGSARILPVKYLVEKTSRLPGSSEQWFPCEKGDWVELSDGVMGRVTSQTPGAVELELFGGARATYATPDFLALHPKNLSAGFRVETSFGIDYKHQSIATGNVPQIMKARLESGLKKEVDPAWVKDISVVFSSASASSLDYSVVVDVTGDAAQGIRKLRTALQRLLVDACNENGWEIPFTQLTVHQAK